ncbi:hypothetical protein BAE44_0007718 [Dichanthelium oligosanthes]|uniref:Uncharacterized protein n=1 Tax=Dichanthelium oligosanthes TaxID=888268 RepID=A0A1E5W1P8_9POAL|nr:hypothetical protein BAE44_0007718 [Dichanthelium oligosanthes]
MGSGDQSKCPPQFYLGKSKAGVYYASVHVYDCRLQVWSYRDRGDVPWLLRYCHEEDDDDVCCDDEDGNNDEGQLEWSSNIEDIPESEEDGAGGCCKGDGGNDSDDWAKRYYYCDREYIDFLGFHPYKEIVCLYQSLQRAIAYHLNCSKIQDAGGLDLHRSTERIEMPYPYTPCWMGMFPEKD